MQQTPPLVSNGNLGWELDTLARITPERPLPNYQQVRLGNRQQLHQVRLDLKTSLFKVTTDGI